jgi:ubiquitin C-terminal hydrolase
VQRDVTEFLDGLLSALPFADLFRINTTEWKVTSGVSKRTGSATSFLLAVDIREASNLMGCLEKFEQPELRTSIYCTISGRKVAGTVATTIDFLPPILIIKLNRFEYDGDRSRKLNSKLEFPDELDLQESGNDCAKHRPRQPKRP